jgi:hypothetical protein
MLKVTERGIENLGSSSEGISKEDAETIRAMFDEFSHYEEPDLSLDELYTDLGEELE